MKKTALAGMMILLSIPAFAGPCFDQAKIYGKGRSSSDQVITVECLEIVKQSAGTAARTLSKNKIYQAVGYANVLIIRKFTPLTDFVIAGPQTNLEDIKATAVDEVNKEVSVYDAGMNAVLTFDATMGGNLGPKRILKLKKEENVTVVGLSIDSNNDELHVRYSGNHGTGIFFRQANAQGHRRENSQLELRRSY